MDITNEIDNFLHETKQLSTNSNIYIHIYKYTNIYIYIYIYMWYNKMEYKETEEFWLSSHKIRSRTTFIFINKHSFTYVKWGQ